MLGGVDHNSLPKTWVTDLRMSLRLIARASISWSGNGRVGKPKWDIALGRRLGKAVHPSSERHTTGFVVDPQSKVVDQVTNAF